MNGFWAKTKQQQVLPNVSQTTLVDIFRGLLIIVSIQLKIPNTPVGEMLGIRLLTRQPLC